MDSLKLGSDGEKKGAAFLKKRGYRILCRNFRTRSGEIDIIAEKDREIVFIEVKTRSSARFGYPEEAVDARKVARLVKASGHYMMQYGHDMPCRFEILSILSGDNGDIINILPVDL